MSLSDYSSSVFVNCPFDEDYRGLFHAIVFAVFDCGYRPRCALEFDDAGETRIEKITKIIAECKFGIHDISRTELDHENKLPRFNMPLELGIFLGAKKFGAGHQKSKVCVILDREKYRFQAYISDIAGQDVRSHDNSSEEAIKIIRNWLATTSRRVTIPGGKEIIRRYHIFSEELPDLCAEARIEPSELTYIDYTLFVSEWLNQTDLS